MKSPDTLKSKYHLKWWWLDIFVISLSSFNIKQSLTVIVSTSYVTLCDYKSKTMQMNTP